MIEIAVISTLKKKKNVHVGFGFFSIRILEHVCKGLRLNGSANRRQLDLMILGQFSKIIVGSLPCCSVSIGQCKGVGAHGRGLYYHR